MPRTHNPSSKENIPEYDNAHYGCQDENLSVQRSETLLFSEMFKSPEDLGNLLSAAKLPRKKRGNALSPRERT